MVSRVRETKATGAVELDSQFATDGDNGAGCNGNTGPTCVRGAHNSRRLLLRFQQWGWGAEDSTTYQLDRWSHHAGVLNAKAAVTNE